MKKGLTLTVVLLIVAAVLAVVGFVQKGEVQKKLDEATLKADEAVKAVETQKADYEGRMSELAEQVTTLTADLETAKNAAVVPAAAPVKHGLGMVTSIGSLADATAEKAGAAQVNTTVASLVLDAEDKIESVKWDVQQTRVTFSVEGKPVDLPEAEAIKTKIEKGADYGMVKASGIGKEWFEQIAAFEAYAVGKTVEELTSMPVYERDASHPAVPDVEELKTSVTINVGDYLAALTKAAANANQPAAE